MSPGTVRFRLTPRPAPGQRCLGATLTRFVSAVGRPAPSPAKQIMVLIKAGLPAIQFDAVVSHELSHAWLELHDVSPTTIVNEGLAEMAAYWTLGRIGGPVAAALQHLIAHNPDPTYGGGYRRVREAERRLGWSVVSAAILRTGRLP